MSKNITIFILFIVSLLAFFPGSYSVDTWSMYNQAINNSYGDWHSPLLSYTWHVLMAITHKYYILYVIQMMLYWVFIWMLLVKINKSNTVFITGLLFSIIILFIPQYIMKDAQFIICWGLASVMMLHFYVNKQRVPAFALFLIGLLLLYGLLIRINALISVVPLLYLYAGLVAPRLNRFVKAGVVVLMCGLAIIANDLFIYKYLKAGREHPVYKLQLLDVIGVSKLTGVNYMPENIKRFEGYNDTFVRNHYTPASIDDIYWPSDGKSIIPYPSDELADSVAKRWQQLIRQCPSVYAGNRWAGFMYYIHIHRRYKPDEYWNTALWIDPNNPLKLERGRNFVTNGLQGVYSFLNDTAFFYPWFWLLLNISLLAAFAIEYYKNTDTVAYKTNILIQLSAILFTISQFPVYQHDRDFRYHYWNVIAVFIGIVILSSMRKAQVEKDK